MTTRAHPEGCTAVILARTICFIEYIKRQLIHNISPFSARHNDFDMFGQSVSIHQKVVF